MKGIGIIALEHIQNASASIFDGTWGAFPLVIAALIIAITLVFLWRFFCVGRWLVLRAHGTRISLLSLPLMRLRNVSPNAIAFAALRLSKEGITVRISDLEAHALAGGNVDALIDGLIAANNANIALPFEEAAAINLSGRNLLAEVYAMKERVPD